MSTDDTRPLAEDLGLGTDDDTTARESREHEDDRTVRRAEAGSTADAPSRGAGAQPVAASPYGGAVVFRRGPAPFAVFLGLLGLLTAGSVLVEEVADVSVPWGDLGPWAVVAGGLVVVLVGLLGLRANRTED